MTYNASGNMNLKAVLGGKGQALGFAAKFGPEQR